MYKLTALTAAAGILASATLAQANSLDRPCTNAPQNTWLTIEALQSKVEALGYTVRKAKLKRACGEFYATDKSGTRVELFVDPTNGTIVEKM
jgi:hypothetical protein